MTRPVPLLSFLALLAVATPARADESTPARDAAAATGVTPRIRATHRVDVIAPGEKVESVIDRMRTQSTGAVRDGRPAETAPAGERRGERGDSRPMGTSGAMMGGGGTPGAGTAGATQGSTSGGMPGMGTAGSGGPAPRGDVPPPDRMRRR